MGKNKDYTRVCNNCGYRWLLPKEWATESKPNQMQIKGAKMQSFGQGISLGGSKGAGARASQLENQRDRFLQNATCANCGGSQNFTQYKPGKAPAVAAQRPAQAPVSPLQTIQNMQGVPQALSQAPNLAPPAGAWHPDPTGRFALRYYDGSGWTAHVQDSSGNNATDRIV